MSQTFYVDLMIDPSHREAFDALLHDHAEGTLAEEEGCLLIDFFVDPRDPNHYAVFEVYADPAAVDAHVSSARFRRFDSANQPMIANKRVHPIGEEIDVSEIVK